MKRKFEVLNQHGDVVQDGVQVFMLKKKPEAA